VVVVALFILPVVLSIFARHSPTSGAQGSTEIAEEGPEGAEPRSDAPGAQEGARRLLWRRVFNW
jgi:hypothetical protein